MGVEEHNPKDPQPTACGLQLLHRSQIPAVYKEPFIIGGYRKPDCSYFECLKYSFVLHNDTINFWSHFVPFWVWLLWLYLLSYSIDFTDPYFYPLLCFWAGACSYVLFSSIAHLFGSKSFTVRTVCFILDYLGIAMYTYGGSLLIFFHQQPTSSIFIPYKWPILLGNMISAITASVLCGLSRFFWVKQRFVVRAGAFVVPYITAIAPFLYRFLVCVFTGQECIFETLYLHVLTNALISVLIFFFVTKIPERFVPGRFDYIGQSHQLFHLTAVTITTIQMYMLPIDAVLRREELSRIPGLAPDVYSTFLPFTIVQVIGLAVVTLFGVLVTKRILISNKKVVQQDLMKREAGKSL